MTYSTLGSIVKYPFSSSCTGKKGKFGFFCTEQDNYQRIAYEMGIPALPPLPTQPQETLRYARHPLVYLVEAADDICYEIMDIEDAHKLKLISYEETKNLLLGFLNDEEQGRIFKRIADEDIFDENERVVYMRACVIGKLESECVRVFIDHEDDILAGTFEGSLIKALPETIRTAYERCATLSVNRIYNSKPVLDVELSGYKIIETLLSTFTEAAIHPDRFHSKQLLNLVSPQYDIRHPELQTRIMAVIDYLCGMTDVFALDIYQKINGISLPIV